MMMILKKKEILIAALVLLIAAAAYINFNFSDSSAPSGDELASVSEMGEHTEEGEENLGSLQLVNSSNDSDYFTEAKAARDDAHKKTKEQLCEILDNDRIDENTKNETQQKLMDMAEYAEKETLCEKQIEAKGFENCICYITADGVNVTVKSDGLSGEDVAKIRDIIVSETHVETKNIKIVEVSK